jgi:hypothetical protein
MWSRVEGVALLLVWAKQSSAQVVDVEEVSVFPCEKVPKDANYSIDRKQSDMSW